MASIENRSRYHVSVKNRDDLTKTFAHSSKLKADEYCNSIIRQKLKPKLPRLDDKFIIRIRQHGLVEQVLYASSLKAAKLEQSSLSHLKTFAYADADGGSCCTQLLMTLGASSGEIFTDIFVQWMLK